MEIKRITTKTMLASISLYCLFSQLLNVATSECVANSTKIVYFYGPSYNDRQFYDLDDSPTILKHPKFTMTKPTTAFMFGYSSSLTLHSVQFFVEAYLKNDSFNFLVIDWSPANNGSYISAQRNLLKLYPKVAESFVKLIDAGLNMDNLTFVGHSMGAIGVGLIGESISNQTNGRILLPRVTALDPSNPAFHKEFILPPIKKSAGKFVDVIHTSAGQRGTNVHTGHVDFWPNGGKPIQPECPSEEVNVLCSHLKTLGYWAEGVANGDSEKFLSFPATSYEEFLDNEANQSAGILMGIDCPSDARGDYYLNVSSVYGNVGDVGIPL